MAPEMAPTEVLQVDVLFEPKGIHYNIYEHADDAKQAGKHTAEGKQHSQAGNAQPDAVYQHCPRLQPPCRQAPLTSSFHLHVQVPVEVIIENTGRGHNQHGAEQGKD
jgi:hypothetical protein